LSTVVDYERALDEVAQKSIEAMCLALETAVFTDENGHGPGVRLGK
jgi:hypothetical protein